MSDVFISYSHKDRAWKDRLMLQLGVLQHARHLSIWDDGQIQPGDDWEPEIEKAMSNARLAVLLVSANALNSQYILGKEVVELLKRRKSDGLRLIPVILSPCQWQMLDWLGAIQGWPPDGKPLSGMSEHDAELALSDLAKIIHDCLK